MTEEEPTAEKEEPTVAVVPKEKRKSLFQKMMGTVFVKSTKNAVSSGEDTTPQVFVRFALGLLDVDDMNQILRPDVGIHFYYKPRFNVIANKKAKVRFQNIDVDKIPWKPEFDFDREMAMAVLTDEAYWYDVKSDLIFGRYGVIPTIQDRWDHSHFPFDRQVMEVLFRASNCHLQQWGEHGVDGPLNYPHDLNRMGSDEKTGKEWLVQLSLYSMADTWSVNNFGVEIQNSTTCGIAKVKCSVSLERDADFYTWNMGLTFALIITAQAFVYAFPYFDGKRYQFLMTLALTAVAFKFTASKQIPKCNYMTFADKYMILGFISIFARLLGEFYLEFRFQHIGCDGDSFDLVNGTEFDNPCVLTDWMITLATTGTWITASVVYIAFGERWLRPAWTDVVEEDDRSWLNPLKALDATITTISAGVTAIEHATSAVVAGPAEADHGQSSYVDGTLEIHDFEGDIKNE